MAKKGEQEQFVVSDRRKFTSEGDLRPDVPPTPDEAPVTTPATTNVAAVTAASDAKVTEAAPPPQTPAAAPTPSGDQKNVQEDMPVPPSTAEQSAQHGDYKAASKQIDSMLDAAGAKRPPDMEMTFEKLILSLYMTAMMQLGMVRDEETSPRPDIVSARQTIDTIALLGEKTKGNLTERESHMLQNCLFELRMAFLEIMKVLTTNPPPVPEKKI